LLHLVASENTNLKKIVVLGCRIGFRERDQAANGICDGFSGLRGAEAPMRMVGEVDWFEVEQIP